MNRPKITVLCEDKQHGSFIRRFLRKRNWRVYTVQRANVGAADRFVIDKFPEYLDAVRKRGGILVTMIDGDRFGILQRIKHLGDACDQKGISRRRQGDKVVVFIPVRSIETWFAYLDGKEVNEIDTYDKLKRERDCQIHVNELMKMCGLGNLRSSPPPSLETACQEYRLLNDLVSP